MIQDEPAVPRERQVKGGEQHRDWKTFILKTHFARKKIWGGNGCGLCHKMQLNSRWAAWWACVIFFSELCVPFYTSPVYFCFITLLGRLQGHSYQKNSKCRVACSRGCFLNGATWDRLKSYIIFSYSSSQALTVSLCVKRNHAKIKIFDSAQLNPLYHHCSVLVSINWTAKTEMSHF